MNNCVICGTTTEITDPTYNVKICSDQCLNKLVVQHRLNSVQQVMEQHIERYREHIQQELIAGYGYKPTTKDIVIIVHNQLSYLKQCVESIKETTKDYTLYIWDNGSDEETKQYIQTCGAEYVRVEENIGFIEPNNELLKKCKSEYIILLNSDTKVIEGWDTTMIGFLQANPEVKQIGYLGSRLDEDGKGGRADFGYNIDYVCGWCSCFPKLLYDQIGLFDPNLKFAYFEDSDFSLQVQELGYKIYSSHMLLVHHFENKTIKEVHRENKINVAATFKQNHEYFQKKWHDYLTHLRVDLR